MFRQGDVLIIAVNEIPSRLEEIKPDQNGKTVLVEGELTGHAHAFYDSTPLYEEPKTKRRFAVIEGGKSVALRHEEHKTIELPPGKYEIIRQTEWHEERPRYVED